MLVRPRPSRRIRQCCSFQPAMLADPQAAAVVPAHASLRTCCGRCGCCHPGSPIDWLCFAAACARGQAAPATWPAVGALRLGTEACRLATMLTEPLHDGGVSSVATGRSLIQLWPADAVSVKVCCVFDSAGRSPKEEVRICEELGRATTTKNMLE